MKGALSANVASFEVIAVLGEGSYGSVLLSRERLDDKVAVGSQLVALKKFKWAHIDQMALRSALREVRILMKLRHPLIIRCDRVFSSNHRLYAVFPFIDGGCGHGLLKTRYTKGLPPQPLKSFAWQLCLVVQYLHSRRVLHRDIKPANVLLSSDGTIRLCDFGFARPNPEGGGVADPTGDDGSLTPYVQTRPYRAPEVLLGYQEYGFPADIWSLGLTIVEMATGATFLNGRTSLDQLWHILGAVREPHPPGLTASLKDLQDLDPADFGANVPLELLRPPAEIPGAPLRNRLAHLDPSLVDLVEACLRLDPAQRATAAELLQMPYFVDVVQVVGGNATLRPLHDEWLKVTRGAEERGGTEGATAVATAASVPVPVATSLGARPGGIASYTRPRDAKLGGAATMKATSSAPSLLALPNGASRGGINSLAAAGMPVAASRTATPKTARADQQEGLVAMTSGHERSRGPLPAVQAATAAPRAAGNSPAAEAGCQGRTPGPLDGTVGATGDIPAAVEEALDAGGSQAALCQSGLSTLAEASNGGLLPSQRIPAAVPTEPPSLRRTDGAQSRQISVPPPLPPLSRVVAAPLPHQPPKGISRGTRLPHSASASDVRPPEHRSPKVGLPNPAKPPDTLSPPLALLTSPGMSSAGPRLPQPPAAPAIAAPSARLMPSQLEEVLPMSPNGTMPYDTTPYYSEVTIDCSDVECEGLTFTTTTRRHRGRMMGYVNMNPVDGPIQTPASSTLSYAHPAWATGAETALTSMSAAAAVAHSVAESQQTGFVSTPAPIDSRSPQCCVAAGAATTDHAAGAAAADERVGPSTSRGRHRRSLSMPAQRSARPWDAAERAKAPLSIAGSSNETLSYPLAQHRLQEPQKTAQEVQPSLTPPPAQQQQHHQHLGLTPTATAPSATAPSEAVTGSPIPIPSLGVDTLQGRPYGGGVYGSMSVLASLAEDACSSWHTNAASGAAGPSCWHDSRLTPVDVQKGVPYGSPLDYEDSRLDAAWPAYSKAASVLPRPLDKSKASAPGDPCGAMCCREGANMECSHDAVRGVGIACGLGRILRRVLQKASRRGSRGG